MNLQEALNLLFWLQFEHFIPVPVQTEVQPLIEQSAFEGNWALRPTCFGNVTLMQDFGVFPSKWYARPWEWFTIRSMSDKQFIHSIVVDVVE